MDKKTIVVVGAGKGMGNHIAEEFGKNDFRIVLMARKQESLDSYVKEFEGKGMEAYGIEADAADTDSLTKAFEKVRTCIHRRGMPDGREIFPPVTALRRGNTLCISRRSNAERREKIRPDGVQRL